MTKYYTRLSTNLDSILLSSNFGHLFLLDANTGQLRWHQQMTLDDDEKRMYIQLCDDIILLGEGSGSVFAKNPKYHLRALDVQTGAEKWSLEFQNPVGPPSLYQGVVYVIVGRHLIALEFLTGKKLWQYQEDCRINLFCLAFHGNVAYYFTNGSSQPRIYKSIKALDLESQKVLWTFDGNSKWLPKFLHMETQFMSSEIYNGVVYVTTLSSLLALDAKSGKELWSSEMDDNIKGVQHSCMDGDLACIRTTQHLTIINLQTQKKMPSFKCNPYPAIFKDSVVYYGDATRNAFVVLESDNWTKKWSKSVHSGSGITLEIFQEDIILVNGDEAWRLDAETGESKWHHLLNFE